MATTKYEDDASVAHHDHAGLHDNHGLHGHHGHHGLDHSATNQSARMSAFGGEAQPGLFRPVTNRKFANPAPMGLSAFALTTFVLSLINLNTRGVNIPTIVLSLAFAYGGLVQLLAGMWEMAVGNTFGATAFASYGGFWISFAIIETSGFGVASAYSANEAELNYALGFYLIGWFLFTLILLVCTLKSTLAFFFLFFTLDLAFLLLAIARFQLGDDGMPNQGCLKAGGVFGLLAAFAAWYNALAGLAAPDNSFFQPVVVHFPWSAKARETKTGNPNKADNRV